MPSLSFSGGKDARPLAMVKGGTNNKEVVYLHMEDGATGKKPAPVLRRSAFAGDLKGFKPAEKVRIFIRLEEALRKGLEPESLTEPPAVVEVYRRMKRELERNDKIELDDEGMMELLPNPDPDKREVWYIAGASGSGKSFVAKGLAQHYKKAFPDREVYLVSKLTEDATLDTLKFLKRINIQSFVDDYPDLEEFRDCLILFDDYNTLTGDAEKVVLKIIDDLATMGRHTRTTMLCMTHYLTQYSKTRLLLNEATHIVVYPLSTSYHALRYLLKNYVGVDEEKIKEHRKCGSRWLCYMKNYPQVAITQKGVELLNA
jgi:hypothetical protein